MSQRPHISRSDSRADRPAARPRLRRALLASLALGALASPAIASGCAASFKPGSLVEGLRVFAVEVDKPYANPGDEIAFSMTYHDGLVSADQGTRPVQIVNFVAKGTIEEGMLSVLAFKRSLSAGILDGGQSEVSLGGSRLARFMKDVQSVTGRMGDGEAMSPVEEAAGLAEARAPGASEPVSAQASADPWDALMQAGAQLVSALRAAGDGESAPHPWLERDPATGARSLRLPLPPPQTARRLADALSVIAASLRGASGRE